MKYDYAKQFNVEILKKKEFMKNFKTIFSILIIIICLFQCNNNENVPDKKKSNYITYYKYKDIMIAEQSSSKETYVRLFKIKRHKPKDINLNNILFYIKDCNLYEYNTDSLLMKNVLKINHYACNNSYIYYIKKDYIILDIHKDLYILTGSGIYLYDNFGINNNNITGFDTKNIFSKKLYCSDIAIKLYDEKRVETVYRPKGKLDFLISSDIKTKASKYIIYPKDKYLYFPASDTYVINCFCYYGDIYYVTTNRSEYFLLEFSRVTKEFENDPINK